ncbi:hypothetical protein B4U79_00342 [Dinothrombium tinctorium]|uniref:Uncharacterized protein n=1 Tax=Dinothrombium tinctorium TaxID=1965070 RepID=A0A3S3PGG5_9ACAR|nr:hypothetical protein B4U79_08448 [Dinothrombium tinctorium]RWS15184.1 hypothetical protein B4U79_00342 [Dinothrombium tinctorium]
MQETGAETLLATAVETAAAESEEVTDMDTEPKRRKKSSLGLNCDRVMCCLLPATGSISYQIFAVHVYFPHLLKRTLSTHHLIFENCLLYNSHIGVGLYLYTRKHMKLVPIYYRVMYSVYGSPTLFPPRYCDNIADFKSDSRFIAEWKFDASLHSLREEWKPRTVVIVNSLKIS